MAEFDPDIRRLPGWRKVPLSDYGELLVAADHYIKEAIPNWESWIDWSTSFAIPSPDIAGFRAFRFLQAESPQFLAALPPEAWSKWAPVIIGFPLFDTNDNDTWQQDLVATAYQQAPNEVIAAVLRRIHAKSQGEAPSVERLLWLIARSWDDRIAAVLLKEAGDSITPPAVMGQLLDELLQRGSEPAIAFACSLISRHSSTDEQERSRAAVAASLLLKHAPHICWSAIWVAMQQNHGFADGMLGGFVWNDRYQPSVAAQLSTEQLAQLYIWLFRRYPPAAGSSEIEESGFVSYQMAVTQWRGTLLTQLKTRGTIEACRALEGILEELPGEEWLKSVLTEAKTITWQRTWTPPQPEAILALSRSSERRIVQNADQLLDVVVESLRRLEEKLQRAEPPRAIDLWNEVEKNRFRPKEEERLSDYLKSHLDDDLRDREIVFNREVANRRGEETDIRVDAVSPNPENGTQEKLSVIIEAKGNWHPKLMSAIEDQLVGRYMNQAKTDHGLYVVGWYNCEKWDATDSRKKRAPKHDKNEAQRRLDKIAQELSKDGKHIRALVIDTSLRY